jgi:hypothetical protein
MKSAYELAMERLEAESGPTKQLSDEEKSAIAEIDKKYDAEIAAVRINFESKLVGVATPDAYAQLKEEMAHDITHAENRREQEKATIWGDA